MFKSLSWAKQDLEWQIRYWTENGNLCAKNIQKKLSIHKPFTAYHHQSYLGGSGFKSQPGDVIVPSCEFSLSFWFLKTGHSH